MKLTILVTCTDRKSAPVAPDLQIRSVRDIPIGDRVALWSQRLRSAKGQRPLRDLYQGEAWAQARRLEQVARASGYEPNLLVASAGLGLREVDYLSAPYGATFNRPHEDAVGATVAEARTWWQALQDHDPQRPRLSGAMIWVLSQTYSDSIGPQLLDHAESSNLLVFGGSSSLDGVQRVPSNRSLRTALGGTANSLNLRMAIRWLEMSEYGQAFAPASHSAWGSWATRAHQTEVYGRTALSDSAVLDFIQSLDRQESGLTKSRALRQLRDAGYACEQRRFNALFDLRGSSA